VTILADDAERASQIDEAHAQEARDRARSLLARRGLTIEAEAEATAALERAVGRLRVAELQRRRAPRRQLPPQELGE
jgi:F0F1-type ATP synthase epsilon subunit